MTTRNIGIAGAAVLGVLALVSAGPASASAIGIHLSISYTDPPDPEDHLFGTAQFFSSRFGADELPSSLGDPIGVDLSPGKNFSFTLYPPGPCFGESSCGIGFSFGGTSAGFNAYAFGGAAPGADPGSAPTIPVGVLFPPGPCFSETTSSCSASGPIFAYDDPIQIGNWAVTINATPLPTALALLPSGLGFLGLLGRRKKRKPAALAA